MDQFIQQQQEDFLNQYQLADTDQNFHPCEIINDNDEQIYNYIEQVVMQKPRLIKELPQSTMNFQLPDLSSIIENFKCSLCLTTVVSPKVIKHCLHFFCKECIEKQINSYKKECPLCKEPLKTKRELRNYDKLANLLSFIRPLITQRDSQFITQYEQEMTKQIHEQKEMTKLLKKQKSKKKSNIDEEFAKMDMELNIEQEEEQKRIQRKAEILKAKKQKEDQIMEKFFKMNDEQMLSKDDQQYFKDYEKLTKQGGIIGLAHNPPSLDIKVRIMYDEDFKSMIFPKIKEYYIRVNSNTPLECAAKSLAKKNQHPEKWQNYIFSLIKKDENNESQEYELTDLNKKIYELQDSLTQEEIILFYRINELENEDIDLDQFDQCQDSKEDVIMNCD